jgi:hypothetical protein
MTSLSAPAWEFFPLDQSITGFQWLQKTARRLPLAQNWLDIAGPSLRTRVHRCACHRAKRNTDGMEYTATASSPSTGTGSVRPSINADLIYRFWSGLRPQQVGGTVFRSSLQSVVVICGTADCWKQHASEDHARKNASLTTTRWQWCWSKWRLNIISLQHGLETWVRLPSLR